MPYATTSNMQQSSLLLRLALALALGCGAIGHDTRCPRPLSRRATFYAVLDNIQLLVLFKE